jgi:hypothetical protein
MPHTKYHRVIVGCAVVVAVGSGEMLFSQTPRFRVTDVVNLGGNLISSDTCGTAGINNKGQVVYTRLDNGKLCAWVWLPGTEYGFAANTIHTFGSSTNDSIARDINEDGKIAGVSGGLVTTGGKATKWSLASNTATPTLFNTGNSEAFAINNHSTPLLVRVAELEEQCGPFQRPIEQGILMEWHDSDRARPVQSHGHHQCHE